MVTVAGLIAGGVNYNVIYNSGGWLSWLGAFACGAVFALIVLGTAAAIYLRRFRQMKWTGWLAAAGILSAGMPTAFFSAMSMLFVCANLPLGSLQSNDYIVPALVVMYLTLSVVGSAALALALSVNFFDGARMKQIFLTCVGWMIGLSVFSQVLSRVELAVLNRDDSGLVLCVGLQVVSAMLIGYFLDRYGVAEEPPSPSTDICAA